MYSATGGINVLGRVIVWFCFVASVASKIEFSDSDRQLLDKWCGKPLASELLDYAKLHDDILAKRAPQRYLISVPVEAGLADRLLGMMSQFWLAFFSKHAFQIGIYEKLPRFEYAYDYRFINWTRPPDETKYTAPLMFTYKGVRGYDGVRSYDNKEISPDHYHMEYLINNDGRASQLYGRENLLKFPSESKTFPYADHSIFTSSNRGGIHYMFDNPTLKDKLQELGAKKDSMFRCAYAFLFKENQAVESITEPFRKRLLTPYNNQTAGNGKQVSPLRIGIGIRAGDKTFDPAFDASLHPSVYQKHTSCATNIQKTYLSKAFPGTPHDDNALLMYPWYAMSESLKTRQMLADAFHQRVVVDTGNAYFHGDCSKHTTGGCDQMHLQQAIIRAVSQLQLFALCNVHIVSNSGFPRVGAMLSDPPYHVYLSNSNRFVEFGTCHFDQPAPLDKVMSVGAGV